MSTDTQHAPTTTELDPSLARRAGAALVLAAALAIAGFTVLGTVFEYPQILEEPVANILDLYRAHQAAVMTWFGVLVVSSALMAPAGVWLGRMAGGALGRWITVLGVAAALVQVVGLQRWVTLVPGISEDALDPTTRVAAEDRFELFHTVLGKVVGETFGYAFTAAFSILVVVALRRTVLPAWLGHVGTLAAVLIATGVVIPVLEPASLTSFAGYVLWCAWIIATGAVLLRASGTPVGRMLTSSDRAKGTGPSTEGRHHHVKGSGTPPADGSLRGVGEGARSPIGSPRRLLIVCGRRFAIACVGCPGRSG